MAIAEMPPNAFTISMVRAVEIGDAVPQNVAAGRAHQQRALADAEMRHGADAEQVRLVEVKAIVVARPHRIERGPGLSGRRDVLAFLGADRAGCGRLVGGRVLRSAGGADEGRHLLMLEHVPFHWNRDMLSHVRRDLMSKNPPFDADNVLLAGRSQISAMKTTHTNRLEYNAAHVVRPGCDSPLHNLGT